MTTAKLQNEASIARVRTGVGMAGMFVVACFGAAMFFTVEPTQASENLAAGPSVPEQVAQIAGGQ